MEQSVAHPARPPARQQDVPGTSRLPLAGRRVTWPAAVWQCRAPAALPAALPVPTLLRRSALLALLWSQPRPASTVPQCVQPCAPAQLKEASLRAAHFCPGRGVLGAHRPVAESGLRAANVRRASCCQLLALHTGRVQHKVSPWDRPYLMPGQVSPGSQQLWPQLRLQGRLLLLGCRRCCLCTRKGCGLPLQLLLAQHISARHSRK